MNGPNCSSCNYPIQLSWRFCPSCGTSLDILDTDDDDNGEGYDDMGNYYEEDYDG